jgi:glucosylceramidase
VSYLATEATVAVGVRGTPWYVPSTTQDYWSHGEFYGTYILNDLNNWSEGFIDWNLLLDQNGGPDHGDPTGELCEGLIPCGSNAQIIADVTQKPPKVYKQAFYWYMAHVSLFVPPGSVVINCTVAAGAGGGDAANLTAAAFSTPGGGTAFVVMNARDDARTLVLSDARFGSVQATVAAHSIETWLW